MTPTITERVEVTVPCASNQDRLLVAAQHMCAAEAFLHTARQAGIDEWMSIAYRHLHDAVAEHNACLRAGSTRQSASPPSPQYSSETPGQYGDIAELHTNFPHVPERIVTAVFAAYLPVTRTTREAVQATRERLSDALAA